MFDGKFYLFFEEEFLEFYKIISDFIIFVFRIFIDMFIQASFAYGDDFGIIY